MTSAPIHGPLLKSSRALLTLALVFAVAEIALESARNIAAHHGTQAAYQLMANRPLQALNEADAALAWYPYLEPAQYTQLLALRNLGMWDRLSAAATRARQWHPDPTVPQLAAEAAQFRGDAPAAARETWAALWRTPYPPPAPAQSWRAAMNLGRLAWGPADPRVAAAAVRTLSLMDQDPSMRDPGMRRQALAETSATLKAAGAPLTAEVIARRK